MTDFATVGLRAWWAYYCLPRNAKGEPPRMRKLETEHGLSNNTIPKIVWDELGEPGITRAYKIAEALSCSPEWLFFGKGERPMSSWPIPARPDKKPESPSRTRRNGKRSITAADVELLDRDAERIEREGEPAPGRDGQQRH